MKNVKYAVLMMLGFLVGNQLFAQRGGGGERLDPAEMIKKEKAAVLEKVTDLNKDQILIFDQVYKEYEASITKIRSEGDRETMRTKMTEVRTKKDEAIKSLFNETQYAAYKEVSSRQRPGGRGNRPQQGPAN